jgi:hypothetical protein
MIHLANDIAAEHLRNVEAFADKLGPEMRKRLDEQLTYLGEYAGGVNTRCVLYKDFAPASFEFVMQRRKAVDVDPCDLHIDNDNDTAWNYWFNGGCIFHGPHDGWGSGAAPTFAVTLTREDGWSIHT